MATSIKIIYNGFKFTRYPESNRRSDRVYYSGWVKFNGKNKKTRLHRYKYEIEIGEIPKGYDVHHIDEDTENNDSSNFALKTRSEHKSIHYQLKTEDQKKDIIKNLIENAIPASKEWHSSTEGLLWHSEHAKKNGFSVLNRPVTRPCDQCEKQYNGYGTRSRFCSNNCKSAYRRKNGLDAQVRVCGYCRCEFVGAKYQVKKYCSSKCRKKSIV